MAGLPFFTQVLACQKAAGTAFNTYTIAKTVINQTELVSLPANFFDVGTRLRITVKGAISNVVTSQPTFTFQVMLGAVAVYSSGAITTNTTANTNIPFTLVIDLRCDTIGTGTTAKFLGIGKFDCTAMASGSTSLTVPTTAPAVGTGFDSTAAQTLDFFVGISASNASNGITIWDYCVEQLWS